MLFCRAKQSEWQQVKDFLETDEIASGQSVNKQKSSLFFSSNTSASIKNQIRKSAGVSICTNLGKYLGLPLSLGRFKYHTFGSLKDRIWQRLNDWKNTFLTQAGKEILLKAVIQAISTYTISVFKLPRNLCKEIASMMSKTFGGNTKIKKGEYIGKNGIRWGHPKKQEG